MRAEDLVSKAAARGVDLVQAASTAATKKAWDGTVRKNGATILLPPRPNRAKGSATRSIERPAWSIAELGVAAAGVPQIQFQAACYAFAGDRTNYWLLHAALTRGAQGLAADRSWPATAANVHGLPAPYLQCLAKLVLDEDWTPQAFRTAPELFAIFMFTTAEVWERDLAERFQDLKAVWTDWLQTAARIIQAHLADDIND